MTSLFAKIPVPVGYVDGSLEPVEISYPQKPNNFKIPIKSSKKSLSVRAFEAAKYGKHNDIKQCILDGFDVNSLDARGSSALHWAAGGGHIEICKLLIQYGADVLYGGKKGRDSLMWAARNGQTDTCMWFANNTDANIHACTHNGVNVFHWAVWSSQLTTVKWAVKVGIDPFAVNRWGCGAIHWACATGNVALCSWLHDKAGLDFTLCNNQGHDGLMKAAWNGHKDLCEYLLTNGGCNAVVKDRAGCQASELAHINGHAELSMWLKEKKSHLKVKNIVESKYRVHLENKAFTIYYRTQFGEIREQNAIKWESFIYAMQCMPPISLRIVHGGGSILASSKLKELILKQILKHQLSSSNNDVFKNKKNVATSTNSILFKKICNALTSGTDNRPLVNLGPCLRISAREWHVHPSLHPALKTACNIGLLEMPDPFIAMFAVKLLKPRCTDLVLDLSNRSSFSANRNQTTLYNAARVLEYMALDFAALKSRLSFPIPSHFSGCVVVNGTNAKHFLTETRQLRDGSCIGCHATVLTVGKSTAKFPCFFEADTDANYQQLLFDRVLVEAQPCSSDGLLPSNPDKWKTWNIDDGIKFHTRQLKTLLRGLHLLAPGGRLVYSSHSLNPIENEAVVLAALQRYKGAVKLVDTRKEDHSRYTGEMAGMKKWCVPDETVLQGISLFRFLENWNDVAKIDSNNNKSIAGLLRSTMFISHYDKKLRYELSKCIRIMPYTTKTTSKTSSILSSETLISIEKTRKENNVTGNDNNDENVTTDTFFAAVFTKTNHRDAGVEFWNPLSDQKSLNMCQKTPSPKFSRSYRMMDTNSTLWCELIEFYGLLYNNDNMYGKRKSGLFFQNENQIFIERSASKSTNTCENEDITSIRFVSKNATRILKFQALMARTGVNVLSAGIPLFVPIPKGYLVSADCPRLRPATEAVEILSEYMTRRVVTITPDIFLHFLLLKKKTISLPVNAEAAKKDAIWKAMLEFGCCDVVSEHINPFPGGLIIGTRGFPGNIKCGNRMNKNEKISIFLPCILSHRELSLFADKKHIRNTIVFLRALLS